MRNIFLLLLVMSLGPITTRGDETPNLPLSKDIKEMNISSCTTWMIEMRADGSGLLVFGAADWSHLPKGSPPFLEVYEKLKVGLKVQKAGEFDTAIFFSMLDQHNVSHTFVVAKSNREYVMQLMQTAFDQVEPGSEKERFSQILKEHPFLPPPAK